MRKIGLVGLVEKALESKGRRIISVPDLIYSIRADLPQCEHTDEELAVVIAGIAVRKGCDLSFALPGDFRLDVSPAASG